MRPQPASLFDGKRADRTRRQASARPENAIAKEERGHQAAEAVAGRSARERLDRLTAAVVADADRSAALEMAVRAWAAQDGAARVALERIDRLRLGYLETLFAEITGKKREARDLARTVYLLLLGSHHVLPPVPVKDVARLWSRVLDTL
jgi:hypothetical protein